MEDDNTNSNTVYFMIEGSIKQSLGQLRSYRPHIEIVALSKATASEQLASA